MPEILEVKTSDLTTAALDGTGVFDVLMRANKEHLEAEFNKNRIKGPEYATVYLGALESIMGAAVTFLLQSKKAHLESQLLEQQILLGKVEVLKANAELEILNQTKLKIPAEIALLNAQKDLVVQQRSNAVIEGTVLVAQECKLRAEFDVLKSTDLKTGQETQLLLWKTNTEKAQTLAMGVDENSVLGRQKALYNAQTGGFQRDAEQKAAKIMVDSWNVRRTTDEGTVADANNQLHDPAVGRAVGKLLAGVNA